MVATAPTVYGIETQLVLSYLAHNQHCYVATVHTVYGIETYGWSCFLSFHNVVARVLTVYGIETCIRA